MKKITAILLSAVFLLSQLSLSIGTHFCGGEAVETKILFGETHLGCDMPDIEESRDSSEKDNKNGISFDKPPCCKNEYQTVQSTNEFIKDAAQIIFKAELPVEYICSTLNFDLLPKTKHQSYTEYTFPQFEKDIQVLFQTFLI